MIFCELSFGEGFLIKIGCDVSGRMDVEPLASIVSNDCEYSD